MLNRVLCQQNRLSSSLSYRGAPHFLSVPQQSPFSTKSSSLLKFSEEVEEALHSKKPIVALESTIISHGMPYPKNIETAVAVEQVVRQNKAIPATIAILNGQIHVGLTQKQLEYLGDPKHGKDVIKTSRRDLAYLLSQSRTGSTTVSATSLIATKAGIRVFATGGIGGVHRGVDQTMDISADLTELGRNSICVVCAGAKSILDIPRTLEFLETQGVTVVSFGSDFFPAFFLPSSGYKAAYRIDTPDEVARLIHQNLELELNSGIVVAQPIPSEHVAETQLVQDAINTALRQAEEASIVGKEITPFLFETCF